jgi:hypothetical protein
MDVLNTIGNNPCSTRREGESIAKKAEGREDPRVGDSANKAAVSCQNGCFETALTIVEELKSQGTVAIELEQPRCAR